MTADDATIDSLTDAMSRSESWPLLSSDAEAVSGLVAALRQVHDVVTGVEAPGTIVSEAAELLERVVTLLAPYRLRLDRVGRWDDLLRTRPTRTLHPPLLSVELSSLETHAKFEFSPFYIGGKGAAHGGAVALLFDDVLGRLANRDRGVSRTAYLHIEYHNVTPVGRPLRLDARVDRIEGRKRFVSGRILDGDVVTAEAAGLFIELRDGAP